MFFKNKQEQEIVFTNVSQFHESTVPVPATQGVPEWYKQMPARRPNKKIPTSDLTIKKCVPVFDAMSAGYLFFTPCDLYVTQVDGEPQYTTSMQRVIEYHSQSQANLHPAANGVQFPKWINAWSIKTPRGYSTLFVPPIHNPNPWFVCFEGLVDTDKYIGNVNFPFVLKDPKFEGLIPAGTPLIQAIPFKRDNWKFTIGGAKEKAEAENQARELNMFFWDRYKTLYRTIKNWNYK